MLFTKLLARLAHGAIFVKPRGHLHVKPGEKKTPQNPKIGRVCIMPLDGNICTLLSAEIAPVLYVILLPIDVTSKLNVSVI